MVISCCILLNSDNIGQAREANMIRTYMQTFIRAGLILAPCLISSPVAAKDVITDATRFTVQTTTSVEYSFGADVKGTSRGSGFLIDRERGWIATNAHVVQRSPSRVRVSFKETPYYTVDKVYIDSHLDFAIVKIDPDKIPPNAIAAELACKSAPKAGTQVIAFGHPWGLEYTATRGIISGVKTLNSVEQLQTDAAINPGNSGGPLIEEETGQILGINASGLTNSEGLNFAVPIPLACTIIDLLKAGRDPAPPILPAALALTLGDRELVVADIGKDWADKLSIGDRVLSIDGEVNVKNQSRLFDKLRGKDFAPVQIKRGAQELSVTLAIPNNKDKVSRKGIYVAGMLIGVSTIALAPQNDMYVQMVNRASMAEQAQIREGDVILAIDGKPTRSHEDLMSALMGRENKEVEVMIKRERSQARYRYDYYVRKLDIDNLVVIDETGVRK
jgi:S1-C subfamily serine protease